MNLIKISLCLIIAISSCTSKKEDGTFTFKLGHLANEDHVWHQSALHFAELVSEKSEGKITIKVYPNEQLGSESDNLTGIMAGTMDMTITGETLQNYVEEAALVAVPYMIGDTAHLQKVAGGPIGQKIEEKISEVGFRPVAWFQRGARQLTSKKPVRTPEDLRGMILRVPNVPLFVNTWQAMGAKATPMAFSEVFTALQQGTIQAQENPLSLIHSAAFYEVQDYVNLTDHVIGWVYLVIGEKQFQKLPEDLQNAVLEAGQEMQQFHDKLFIAQQKIYEEKLKDAGMEFIEVDKAAFRQKALPAVKANLKPAQLKLFEAIMNEEPVK